MSGELSRANRDVGRPLSEAERNYMRRGETINNYRKLEQPKPKETDMTLKLRGEEVHFTNIQNIEMRYTKCSPEKLYSKRIEFQGSVRKAFLRDLGHDTQMLKKHGFNSEQIKMICDGKVPPGYQVHHKKPLDDGGTNDFQNLVLIKNDPYHQAITIYMNKATRGMEPGEIRRIKVPVPNGSVYP